MKINKKIFISVLLVLVMLGVMGTASAADSLDNNLAAQNTVDDAVSADASDSGDNSVSSTNDGLLRNGETTIYVDSN